jgi:hypothetical protein
MVIPIHKQTLACIKVNQNMASAYLQVANNISETTQLESNANNIKMI